ncbi:hypothetical protein MTYP_02270 [Methylophilaceae bacterium]|nr:hypothetical protein MTYP_02270 [Methylophilaceae bacterium]
MIESREHTALHAYINLLRRKGMARESLRQREMTVLKLVPYIEYIPPNGPAYRQAVDRLFETVEKAEWPILLPVLREYFSFWINDIKAIAAMNEDRAFESGVVEWKPVQMDIKYMLASLDAVTLTSFEMMPLERYEQALRSGGADELFLDTSRKLVKMLLLRLRSAPHKQPNVYRQAVDANLALFTREEMHQLLLKVGREFYYFWKGDAEAPSHMRTSARLALAA